MKNIVICCDGTGDKYGSHNSNVVHLVERLVRHPKQVACYDPGVGTLGNSKKILAVKHTVRRWLSQMFGYGVQKNIVDIYCFLMRHYQLHDRIFIFGFSRGAFTALCLVSLLEKCGLLEDANYNLVPYISEIYHQKNNATVAAGFKKTFCRQCTPYFVGLLDTVEALGALYRSNDYFIHHTLTPAIQYGYHALAIDEHRSKFKPILWAKPSIHTTQVLQQVWFAGAHCDIGGGYAQRGLSDISLLWLLTKAHAAGLTLCEHWQHGLNPDPTAPLHRSRSGVWKVWPNYQRTIPPDAYLHDSVLVRQANVKDYHPLNLPETYVTAHT